MNKYFLLFLTISCQLLTVNCFAQKSAIDSLKNIIETAEHDTTRAKALNTLAWKLQYNKPDTAFILAEKSLQLYKKTGDQKGISNAYHSMGSIKDNVSEYEKALEYYNKSLKIRESLGDKQRMANSYGNIGIIYYNQSDYPRALNYFLKSLKIKEKLLERNGNPDEIGRLKQDIAGSYITIGSIYLTQSDYPTALDYQLNAMRILDELGNKDWLAMAYNNIGIIYHNQSDYPLALDYYFKSLKIDKELGDKATALANTYNNIGNIYDNQSDYPQALYYYFKSLKIREEVGNKQGMAISYTNIGSLYTSMYEQGDSLEKVGAWAARNPDQLIDTAMYYQQKALSINKELSDEYYMTFSLSGIADIYFKKKEYNHALTYYQEAALLADSVGALERASEAHKGLSETYEQTGAYKKSLDHYKLYSTLKDSVFNEEKSKDLGKLEAKHEMQMAEQERKRLEIEEFRLENEKIDRRNLLQYSGALIFIVALFITILFSGRLNIPIRLAEGGVFFTFLLVFEFLLVLTDPYLENWTGGEPAYKLIVNAGLAGFIFPLHQFFEGVLKKRILKRKLEKVKSN